MRHVFFEEVLTDFFRHGTFVVYEETHAGAVVEREPHGRVLRRRLHRIAHQVFDDGCDEDVVSDGMHRMAQARKFELHILRACMKREVCDHTRADLSHVDKLRNEAKSAFLHAVEVERHAHDRQCPPGGTFDRREQRLFGGRQRSSAAQHRGCRCDAFQWRLDIVLREPFDLLPRMEGVLRQLELGG